MTYDTLRDRLTGPVVLPGDDAYTRLVSGFQLAVTARPALIVEAHDAADVAAAVRYAAERGLPVGVQATGHGLADPMDGALLVHTGRLDECVVHDGEGWARVGAGVRGRALLLRRRNRHRPVRGAARVARLGRRAADRGHHVPGVHAAPAAAGGPRAARRPVRDGGPVRLDRLRHARRRGARPDARPQTHDRRGRRHPVHGGALANLAAGTGEERLARSYDPDTLARLVEIADRYDPAGVLRVGQVPIRKPR